MKILFLESSSIDFEWFIDYYENIFTQGRNKAKAQFYSAIYLLESNPYSGKTIENTKFRKISIYRTPFSFIYTVDEENNLIKIVRIWDNRRKPAI